MWTFRNSSSQVIFHRQDFVFSESLESDPDSALNEVKTSFSWWSGLKKSFCEAVGGFCCSSQGGEKKRDGAGGRGFL